MPTPKTAQSTTKGKPQGRGSAALQSVLFEILVKSIVQIERAIFDNKRFYIWYLDLKKTKVRTDFELTSETLVTELIAKIRFILKSVCGTQGSHPLAEPKTTHRPAV